MFHNKKERLDMRVMLETIPTLQQCGGNVDMDDGTSRFDTGDKYWPAQSHLYDAMVGVDNTVTKVGEVGDQNLPEEKVVMKPSKATAIGVGLGRGSFDHPDKTAVTGATKLQDGECNPDPKEEQCPNSCPCLHPYPRTCHSPRYSCRR
jgi:hypothetical protein